MVTEVFDLLPTERQAASVKQIDTQLNEWHKQQQMQRRGGVYADLRSDLVESKGPGEQDDSQSGYTHRWIDTDHHAQCQTPRQTPRGYAATQLAEQRP